MDSFVTNMFETLLAGGRIMVGETGYFAVERKAAHVDGGKLYPPLRQMVFVPDASVEDAGDGGASVAEGLRVWMPELQPVVTKQLAMHPDTFEVKGIGVFVKEEGTDRYVRTEGGEVPAVPLPATVETKPLSEFEPEPLALPESVTDKETVSAAPVEAVAAAASSEASAGIPEAPQEDSLADEETGISFEPDYTPQEGLAQPAAVRSRRKTGWLAAAVILMLLMLGAGGGYLFSVWRNGQRPQPVAQQASPAASPAVPEVQPVVPGEWPETAAAGLSSEKTIEGTPELQPEIQTAQPAVQQVSGKEALDFYVYTPDRTARYYVIVASLTTEQQAMGQLRRLSDQGLSALRIVRFDTAVYRLVSGPGCSTYAEAKELLQQVRTVAEKAWIFQNL